MSRSKGNQTMKLGQSIECNMRNIFLGKSNTKFGEEVRPRPFSEKLKIDHISGSMAQSFIQFVFTV